MDNLAKWKWSFQAGKSLNKQNYTNNFDYFVYNVDRSNAADT